MTTGELQQTNFATSSYHRTMLVGCTKFSNARGCKHAFIRTIENLHWHVTRPVWCTTLIQTGNDMQTKLCRATCKRPDNTQHKLWASSLPTLSPAMQSWWSSPSQPGIKLDLPTVDKELIPSLVGGGEGAHPEACREATLPPQERA